MTWPIFHIIPLACTGPWVFARCLYYSRFQQIFCYFLKSCSKYYWSYEILGWKGPPRQTRTCIQMWVPGAQLYSSKMKMNSFGGMQKLCLCSCQPSSKVVGWESWFLWQLRSGGVVGGGPLCVLRPGLIIDNGVTYTLMFWYWLIRN